MRKYITFRNLSVDRIRRYDSLVLTESLRGKCYNKREGAHSDWHISLASSKGYIYRMGVHYNESNILNVLFRTILDDDGNQCIRSMCKFRGESSDLINTYQLGDKPAKIKLRYQGCQFIIESSVVLVDEFRVHITICE